MKSFYLIPTLLLLLVVSAQITAQDTTDTDMLVLPPGDVLINDVPNLNKKKAKRVDYNMQLGTGFSSMPGVGSAPYSYVNPSVNYNATDRLSLNVGMGMGYQHFLSTGNAEQADLSPMMSYYLYAQGVYQVSEKVVVDASVSYTRNDVPNLYKQNQSGEQKVQSDINNYSFGITYQINPTMQVSFHFDSSNDPYRYYPGYYPYGRNNFYSPTQNPYFSPYGVRY